MPLREYPALAVIADAHFHDLYGDYDFTGVETENGRMTARRLTDTARSTRVFNESHQALPAALDDIVRRGIRHVVLAGDYSDDGQVSTLASLARLLDFYRRTHGLVFTATVGNHDIFGPHGRHHGKRLLNPDGSYSFVASSNGFIDEEANGFVLTRKMYCEGYPAGLQAVPDLGFFRRAGDLHWETPFGSDDAPERRCYSITSPDGAHTRRLMDGSYLVEPAPGLWLLMIDANVFVPREEGFVDSTDAGWNAMVAHKGFILDWMKDVARRAREGGKRLLTFSHYPAIDMLNGTGADELELLGNTAAIRRTPLPATARAVTETGIGVHFSGHVHINDTAWVAHGGDWLVNIGVPSLVAFPSAYKVVHLEEDAIRVETVSLDGLARDRALAEIYRKELAVSGKKLTSLIDAPDYGAYLWEHAAQLVIHRYLRKEWPKELAARIKAMTLADLAVLAGGDDTDDMRAVSVVEMLGDWYGLRMGRAMALERIAPQRLALYRQLIGLYAGRSHEAGSEAEKFAALMRMMAAYMDGLPARDFRIALKDGAASGN